MLYNKKLHKFSSLNVPNKYERDSKQVILYVT
jgi:hypothetical protein